MISEEVAANVGNTAIGFSDRIILTVSIGGFLFLAVTIYHIAMLHYQSGSVNAMNKENVDANYEENLANADVSTLTRAQRRARAKIIMKQTRRQNVAATTQLPHHRDEEHDEQIEADNHHHFDDVDVQLNHNGDENGSVAGSEFGQENRQLSRKERQHLAKLAEQRARRQLDEERKRQHEESQEEAMKIKQERIKQKELQAIEDRQQRNRLKEELRKKENEEFLLFCATDTLKVTVEEWINELRTNRVYDINHAITSYGSENVTSDTLCNRIETLLKECRIGGILDKERGIFIYLNDNELLELSKIIVNQGSVSVNSIIDAVSQYICK